MDKEQILKLREKGMSYRDIAVVFGVSNQRIWNIVNNYHPLSPTVKRKRGLYKCTCTFQELAKIFPVTAIKHSGECSKNNRGGQ